MSRQSGMRMACAGAALASIALTAGTVSAQQRDPERIPVVVARAAMWVTMPFGVPRFFDGRVPTEWPADLMPRGARVLGGSILGGTSMLVLRTAVFELPDGADRDSVLSGVFTRAGFTATRPPRPPAQEGFVSSDAAPATMDGFPRFCKGPMAGSFLTVDSTARNPVYAVTLIEGEAAGQVCGATTPAVRQRRFPVPVPPLEPPPGVTQSQGSSGWGNDEASTSATVQTAMRADSLLSHYTSQLVAAGWRAEGSAAVTEQVGVQQFTMRQGEEEWNATLLVLRVGDRSELRLEMKRRE